MIMNQGTEYCGDPRQLSQQLTTKPGWGEDKILRGSQFQGKSRTRFILTVKQQQT
jgi:hypothetical protein